MEIINQSSDEQNSLQAKELQKFFNKVEGVMLVPRENKMKLTEYPMLWLLVSKDTYINFKDYGVGKHIVELLDNKFPLLFITIPDKSMVARLAIACKNTGLTFKLPDQPISQSLVNFLEVTKYDDKIPMMIGFINEGNLAFDKSIQSNVLIVLDGYILE